MGVALTFLRSLGSILRKMYITIHLKHIIENKENNRSIFLSGGKYGYYIVITVIDLVITVTVIG